jgi:hypothetical protein
LAVWLGVTPREVASHLLNNLHYQIEVEGALLDIPDRLQQPARAMQSNNFLLKLGTRSQFPIIYSQASSLGRASAAIELTAAAPLHIKLGLQQSQETKLMQKEDMLCHSYRLKQP